MPDLTSPGSATPGPQAPLLTARAAGALALAVPACGLSALILGEYEFDGLMPVGTGVLFGLVVGELVVEVGRLRSWLVALVAAALVGGALAYAAWRSVSEGLRPFPTGGWVAVVVGAVAVALRCAPERRRRAGQRA